MKTILTKHGSLKGTRITMLNFYIRSQYLASNRLHGINIHLLCFTVITVDLRYVYQISEREKTKILVMIMHKDRLSILTSLDVFTVLFLGSHFVHKFLAIIQI